MEETPLRKELARLGATLSPEGGLVLVAGERGPEEETRALALAWGIHDQSRYGRLRVGGPDHVSFLHNLTSNDVRRLRPGQGQSTVILSAKGRILDRSWLYKLEDAALLVTQPGNRQKVLEHFDFYHFMEELEFEDRTEETALLGAWGPEAGEGLARLLEASLPGDLEPHAHVEAKLAGAAVRVLRHDRFGHRGYRIECDAGDAVAVFRALCEAGAVPVGEIAVDRARVAAGEPAFGRELGEERNPLEAGLTAEVRFDKGCYLGQEVLARLDTYRKVQRFLVQVRLGPEAEPELVGRPKLLLEGKEVGWLSSWAPVLEGNGFWALGYTHKRCHGVDLQLEGRAPARVTATLTTAEGEGGGGEEECSS